ncbi:arylsulfatase A family protein [Lachnospiraceae bacterium JC7]|nr:arylsulfatase A family protein [Lachnospiraceae bacterium JC7]
MTMKKHPNIILILADDLGYGDVSCMNERSGIHTENIDAIAEEGMVLTDCHASSALCTPSRYSVLTGRYNWRSRLKSSVLPGQSFHLIEEGRETIPSLLKKKGYRTAAVGKWHLGMDWKTENGYTLPATYFEPNASSETIMDGIDFTAPVKNGPNAVGFDYFYGLPGSLDQPPYIHIENDRAVNVPKVMMGVKNLHRHDPSQQFELEYGPAEEGFDPSKIVPEMDEKVLSLVKEYAEGEAPFFLYYATLAVHGPLMPSPEYKGKSGLNAYADFVLQLDGFVGRLDALLEEKGIKDDTLVIFTSDNGCSAVADFPTLISKGHNPSYVYRGLKGDIWEGGHRVPFVARWPKHIPAGKRSEALAGLVDLFATCAEIAGISYEDNAGEDSVSLLPVLTGETGKVRDALVHHSAMGRYSIRKGDWKLEFCKDSGNFGAKDSVLPGEKPYQLYNMAGDVTERMNLYGSCDEIEKELLNEIAAYIRLGRSTPGEPQKNTPNPIWPGLDFLEAESVEKGDNNCNNRT